MKIDEMHVWFRQYAQQMGMQNVRAILPEQIDLLINTSITDIINQLIRENIGLTNDRIITDNSKLGQINAFRTLYKVRTIDMSPVAPTNYQPASEDDHEVKSLETRAFNFSIADAYTGKMTTDFEKVKDKDETVNLSDNAKLPDYLFLVDFSLNYKVATNGVGYTGGQQYLQPNLVSGNFETNFFPVRLIDDAYLADTLNDFVLRNRLRSPILVTYNNGTFDLYIDKFVKHTFAGLGDRYTLDNSLVPYKFRMSYIAKPAKVKYAEDIQGENVDCDLPESMHVDILKHAVDLYNTSIQGNLYAAQQQQQAQNREMTRNVARPDNEGYQN